jgi:Domain of unknown function (DUF4276)
MTTKIGIIAEDFSDVEVIKILAKKLSSKTFSYAHFVGKGCGPLQRKTPAWCKAFHAKGCSQVILVHDRDRNDLQTLKARLEQLFLSAPQRRKFVAIPNEELEAWLLSDVSAIKTSLNLRKTLKVIHHPESIPSPKEHIGKIVSASSAKATRYVNTVHNKGIAENIDVSKIVSKCPSFREFREFFVEA